MNTSVQIFLGGNSWRLCFFFPSGERSCDRHPSSQRYGIHVDDRILIEMSEYYRFLSSVESISNVGIRHTIFNNPRTDVNGLSMAGNVGMNDANNDKENVNTSDVNVVMDEEDDLSVESHGNDLEAAMRVRKNLGETLDRHASVADKTTRLQFQECCGRFHASSKLRSFNSIIRNIGALGIPSYSPTGC